MFLIETIEMGNPNPGQVLKSDSFLRVEKDFNIRIWQEEEYNDQETGAGSCVNLVEVSDL